MPPRVSLRTYFERSGAPATPPRSFTAVDFETGNPSRASICAVGLVRVEDGRVVETLNRLVRPPGNEIRGDFTAIHGITRRDTASAPDFATLWPELQPWFAGTVVAHNFSFDGSCLRAALELHALEIPSFSPACTWRLYRRGLAPLCVEHGIPLRHHDALSDALACAELYRRWLDSTG